LLGLPVAIAIAADAASAAPTASAPPPAPSAPSSKSADDGCRQTRPTAETREIVICAQRPQGYRIDPDILEARREFRNRTRPRPPERLKDNSCANVGPMGCGPKAGINLVAAAITAATMAERLAKGQEIGSMFVTDPQPSEYQLYLEAKARREALEAEKAAKVKAKATGAVPAVKTDRD
jgi:hypothetical protein